MCFSSCSTCEWDRLRILKEAGGLTFGSVCGEDNMELISMLRRGRRFKGVLAGVFGIERSLVLENVKVLSSNTTHEGLTKVVTGCSDTAGSRT